jgi:vacuolar-type H+-ATPase subunit I/STV1
MKPDHTQLIPYIKPGTILSHSDATDALDILRGIVEERDALRARVAELEHQSNEWADCSCNALQYLLNIAEEISSPQEAVEDIEKNIAHCREVAAQSKPTA